MKKVLFLIGLMVILSSYNISFAGNPAMEQLDSLVKDCEVFVVSMSDDEIKRQSFFLLMESSEELSESRKKRRQTLHSLSKGINIGHVTINRVLIK